MHCAKANQMVGGAVHVPVDARESRGAVEKILAVVHVKDREALPGLVIVARRKIYDPVAPIAQESRAEPLVFVKLAGSLGVMVTSRSFASMCWPGVTRSLLIRPEMGA